MVSENQTIGKNGLNFLYNRHRRMLPEKSRDQTRLQAIVIAWPDLPSPDSKYLQKYINLLRESGTCEVIVRGHVAELCNNSSFTPIAVTEQEFVEGAARSAKDRNKTILARDGAQTVYSEELEETMLDQLADAVRLDARKWFATARAYEIERNKLRGIT